MKRSKPLQRKLPLRPSRFKRTRPKPNACGSDPAYLAWIRQQPCAVCSSTVHVHAHHSTAPGERGHRGLTQKAPDRETIPLCWRDHRAFHDGTGYFGGWGKRDRRDWQRASVRFYQSVHAEEMAREKSA